MIRYLARKYIVGILLLGGPEARYPRFCLFRPRIALRKNYHFSKGKKNPHATHLKKQVTIRLEQATIDYFKALAVEVGVPYQTLINLYLRDCVATNRRISLEWKPKS